MRYTLCLMFAACGIVSDPNASSPSQVEMRITAPDPRSGLGNRSGCAALPQSPAIFAELWVEGLDEPCALNVTQQQNGDLVTRGSCANVPTGAMRKLTVQWFVVPPSQAREVLIAESSGQADISRPDSKVVEVVFDPSVAQLRPKTEVFALDESDDPGRFDCDGDARSNLLELCDQTLFAGADQCH